MRFMLYEFLKDNYKEADLREFPIAVFKYYYELRLDDVFA